MGLFRKNLKKEIQKLVTELKNPYFRVPESWTWWKKGKIKLEMIEEVDLLILRDIRKLHKEGKLNTELTSKIIYLCKELRNILSNMLRQRNPPPNLQTKEARVVNTLIEELDSLIESTVRFLPGGKLIGPGNWHLYYRILKLTEEHFDLPEDEFGRIIIADTPFTNPIFYSNLPSKIRNPYVLKKYIINTIEFILDPFKKDIDWKYVLFYRRTQPSSKPKPEAYWTYNFNVALRGLRLEHSEIYKKTTVMLVADLHTITSQDRFELDIKDDSIHLIHEKPFNQKLCLCRFRPD